MAPAAIPAPPATAQSLKAPTAKSSPDSSEFLGIQTNNFAEYSGLIAVLNWAVENRTKCLRVVSDSELMVKQMKGQYKVSSPVLRPLFEEARRLSKRLDKFEIRHTLRGGNKEADRLANEAMDKGMKHASPGASRANPYEKPPKQDSVHQVLEGYVKDGVVHLLEGELPDGIFVKVIPK